MKIHTGFLEVNAPPAEGLMMKKEYIPTNRDQRLGYLVEECGEVMAAVGKSLRWGLESFNPELPENERELNYDWIRRELKDLKRAIKMVEKDFNEEWF